ncbi:hypothetical protein GCM10023259_089940 [Thermocatellispora tengchongensis]
MGTVTIRAGSAGATPDLPRDGMTAGAGTHDSPPAAGLMWRLTEDTVLREAHPGGITPGHSGTARDKPASRTATAAPPGPTA